MLPDSDNIPKIESRNLFLKKALDKIFFSCINMHVLLLDETMITTHRTTHDAATRERTAPAALAVVRPLCEVVSFILILV